MKMLEYLVLVVSIALVSSAPCAYMPQGHDLQLMIDFGFNRMDTDKDGQLSSAELTSVWTKEDKNHDGSLTLEEYASAWDTTPEYMKPIFKAWDKDEDGLIQLNQMTQYNHFMDPNGDGIVTYQEYGHYMTQFFQCVYCQNGHGQYCGD